MCNANRLGAVFRNVTKVRGWWCRWTVEEIIKSITSTFMTITGIRGGLSNLTQNTIVSLRSFGIVTVISVPDSTITITFDMYRIMVSSNSIVFYMMGVLSKLCSRLCTRLFFVY